MQGQLTSEAARRGFLAYVVAKGILRDLSNAKMTELRLELSPRVHPSKPIFGIAVVTEYAIDKNNVNYTDKDGKVIAAQKLQVPYVFVYNKDWKDAAGNPKPILGQIELMYTWTNIQPDYKDDKGVVGANSKNYTAALDQLFTAFQAKLKK